MASLAVGDSEEVSPLDLPGDSQRTGVLWKSARGFFGGKWRKRFFVVTKSSLEYFEELKIKGKIPLDYQSHAQVEETVKCPEVPGYFVLKLTTQHEKVHLAAESEIIRSDWIRSLNTVAQILKDAKYSASKPVIDAAKKRRTKMSVSGMPTVTVPVFLPPPPPPPLNAPARKNTGDIPPPQGNVRPSLYDVACMNIGSMKAADMEEEHIGLYCWGENLKNQLGLANSCSSNVSKPEKVKVMSSSQRMPYIVACGASHTFVLTVKSKLFMAGAGTEGQLGAGPKIKTVQRFGPLRELKDTSVAQVSCGLAHTVIRTSAGQVFSWGTGEYGALGLGESVTSSNVPVLVPNVGTDHQSMIERFTCGPDHTVFVTVAGVVKACGAGKFGQLGTGVAVEKQFTAKHATLFGGIQIMDVGCGKNFTAFLSSTGTLFICGQVNMEEHVPEEDRAAKTHLQKPFFVETDGNVIAIATGDEHVLALVKDSSSIGMARLYSFGNGTNGRLGHHDEDDRDCPMLVEGLADVPGKQIACGSAFSCMLSEGGSMFSFGRGHSGGLGNGAFLDVNVPILVEPPEPDTHFSFLACGAKHTMAILAKGAPKGRGVNYAKVDHFKDGIHVDHNNTTSDKLSVLADSDNAYYKDFDGAVYGPYMGTVVQYWLEKNYISKRILVAVCESPKGGNGLAPVPKDPAFRPISSYF